MKQNNRTGKKLLSVLLTLAMVVGLMPRVGLTAYAAGEDITSNINIVVSGSCNSEDHTVSSDDEDEYTVKEGVVVTFKCSKWFTDAVTIYLNGTAVATWPGNDYNSKYVWTAKKDAKINWTDYSSHNANIYLTDTSTVDVTGITLDPATADMTVGGTQTLTATVLPGNATVKTVTWTSSDTTVVTVDENGNITAVGAGKATITATATNGTESTEDDVSATCAVTVPYEDGIGAQLVGYSLSLDGDIGVNFYMELADEIANSQTAYMQFTIPAGSETVTKTVPVKEAGSGTVNSKTYHVFKCNVSAKDMASQITAQIINGDNKGTKYTYSVKDYADYLLKHTADDATYAEAAPLVKKLLNYGAASQTYFGIAGTAVNADLSEAERVIGNVEIPEKFMYNEANTHLPTGVTFAGATLSLKSETTLSLYFTGLPDNTVFACEGKDNVESVKNGSYMVARIRGIKAKELENDFTVTFNGNSNSVTYNPMTYCYNVLSSNTDENLQNVCKALYQYAEAAKAYSE
ncbi:MAG: Ig domain-containing protein [Oscillospiraceae bacterium]|nr:Ig domain-containing protein [Oscillospiraceae bacterium]